MGPWLAALKVASPGPLALRVKVPGNKIEIPKNWVWGVYRPPAKISYITPHYYWKCEEKKYFLWRIPYSSFNHRAGCVPLIWQRKGHPLHRHDHQQEVEFGSLLAISPSTNWSANRGNQGRGLFATFTSGVSFSQQREGEEGEDCLLRIVELLHQFCRNALWEHFWG